jgi:gliding motility-associated-like protein
MMQIQQTSIMSYCVNANTFYQQVTNVTNQTVANSETVVILLPNAFSPNNDGINDLFGIVNPDKIAEMTLLISNRWSQTVFETIDKTNKWDGSYQGNPQSVGIYLYQLKYRLTDHSDWQIQQGTVTLIR